MCRPASVKVIGLRTKQFRTLFSAMNLQTRFGQHKLPSKYKSLQFVTYDLVDLNFDLVIVVVIVVVIVNINDNYDEVNILLIKQLLKANY